MADFAEVDITEDPVYADLEPICQDDGENPVVAIRYSKKFSNVHNYFRAIIHKNEISERALNLSEKVIQLNAANYTAWQFRRECIFKLNWDLLKELEFSKEIAIKSPKNYQLWWHRRIVIEAINGKKTNEIKYDLHLEKELLRDILKGDAKNYHAWSHYHWLLRTYKLYDDELDYLDNKLLIFDVRNNSAWNHRHFVVKQTTGFNDIHVLQREIDFCRKKIEKLAANHSVWYYYSQVVRQYLKNNCDSQSWTNHRLQQIKWIQTVLNKQPYAPRAILFYVDMLTDAQNTNEKDLIEARTLLQLLANKVDRIRYNYYNYLIKEVEKQLTSDTK
eukprot:351488_1